MKEKDQVRRLQDALNMGAWDRFWYPVKRFFSKQYFGECEWLLKVQDALEGKAGLGLAMADQWKLILEEDSAHIQEATAVLQPLYEARTTLEEEAHYLDQVITEERFSREAWKTQLQEVRNELSRMEALVDTQPIGPESLNHLTGYRRRLLGRRSEALLGLGLSQRRLNQAAKLRGKTEEFLAHTQGQLLAYELRRREFAAHKESACLEYQLSSLGISAPLSSTQVLQNEDKQAKESSASRMETAVEYASLVLEDPLNGYKEEDREQSKGILEEFEKDLSGVLNEDQADLWGRP